MCCALIIRCFLVLLSEYGHYKVILDAGAQVCASQDVPLCLGTSLRVVVLYQTE